MIGCYKYLASWSLVTCFEYQISLYFPLKADNDDNKNKVYYPPEVRGVLEVRSIVVSILPSCQDMHNIEL